VYSEFQFVDSGEGDVQSNIPAETRSDTSLLVRELICRDESIGDGESDSSKMLP
jgi:hypothetical protein